LCLCDKFRYVSLILGRIAKQLAARNPSLKD
jgi:hypothetical protein